MIFQRYFFSLGYDENKMEQFDAVVLSCSVGVYLHPLLLYILIIVLTWKKWNTVMCCLFFPSKPLNNIYTYINI